MNTSDQNYNQGVENGLKGNYRKAIAFLMESIKHNNEFIQAQVNLGVAYRKLGDDERALEYYDIAIEINPRYAESHYFRANIFYPDIDLPGGIAGYTRAIGLQPELIEAHRGPLPQDRLTDFCQHPSEMYWIRKPAERILRSNEILNADPQKIDAYQQRGTAYFELWNYEQALSDYSHILDFEPQDEKILHFRGLAHEQLGNLDQAISDYLNAIMHNPDFSSAHINLGVAYGKAGKLSESLASFTEGIRLAPTDPDGYFNRGTALFQMGDYPGAVKDFSKVITIAPKDETAYFWRGQANEKAGRKRKAISDYKKFIRISQNPRARETVAQILDQLT